jgi:DsbC/DsbD-like thiol-disulfide interchange protein
MRPRVNARRRSLLASLAFLLALVNLPATARTSALAPQTGRVPVNGYFSVDPAQQGTTFQAAIVLAIPNGLHVNSNRPLGKFAIPTKVVVEAPRGMRVTPVSYPRGKVRSFPFAPNEKLAVYEGEAVMRFNVTVPANYQLGVAHVRAIVTYQSCSDEVCFPPQRTELSLPIAIVTRDTPMNRVNGRLFGGNRRRG